MNKNLYLAHSVVALEASNPLIPGLELFGRVGPAFTAGLKDIVKSLHGFFDSKDTIPLSNEHKRAANELTKMPYATIADVAVPVPIGFKGDLEGYGNYLLECLGLAKDIDVSLNNVVRALSVIVTSPGTPVDATWMAAQQGTLALAQSDIVKKVDTWLDPHRSNAKVALSAIMQRNGDWTKIAQVSEAVKYELASLDRKSLLNKTSEVDRLLAKLIDQTKRDMHPDIDSEWLRRLSDSIYSIATNLEFISVTYYRALAYLQSVEDISGQLVAMAKK